VASLPESGFAAVLFCANAAAAAKITVKLPRKILFMLDLIALPRSSGNFPYWMPCHRGKGAFILSRPLGG
jgi:hypothetical protein